MFWWPRGEVQGVACCRRGFDSRSGPVFFFFCVGVVVLSSSSLDCTFLFAFGSSVFVAFTVLLCRLVFSDLYQQLTKITARPFTENQTSLSSCFERNVVIQLGHLIRVSLSKHGFQKSRVGFSKWSKHGLTTLLVAGHDPPIDITISYKFACAGCNACYVGETTRHFSTRVREHLVSDRASHIFKHLQNSEHCRTLCSQDCFHILDHTSTSFQLKIKEAFHIHREKPSLNQQLYHVNLKLSL